MFCRRENDGGSETCVSVCLVCVRASLGIRVETSGGGDGDGDGRGVRSSLQPSLPSRRETHAVCEDEETAAAAAVSVAAHTARSLMPASCDALLIQESDKS